MTGCGVATWVFWPGDNVLFRPVNFAANSRVADSTRARDQPSATQNQKSILHKICINYPHRECDQLSICIDLLANNQKIGNKIQKIHTGYTKGDDDDSFEYSNFV